MRLVIAISLTTLGGWLAYPAFAVDGFRQLKATEIRSIIIGKTVTDKAHWADKFINGGVLGGHQLGRPQTGSWTLSRNGEVCVVRKASTVESDCFEIWINGDQVQYRRADILMSEGVLRDQ